MEIAYSTNILVHLVQHDALTAGSIFQIIGTLLLYFYSFTTVNAGGSCEIGWAVFFVLKVSLLSVFMKRLLKLKYIFSDMFVVY